ncbi:unnamed protein product [Pleuronectes platessa]|uniref:Uncharacterized protein n=1 Tax=Pleuronectes platessa TaxID=8262 RepID=A0A9N7Y763_PLEPL|nr:unnamed protein product [Pleuronectes platessa]
MHLQYISHILKALMMDPSQADGLLVSPRTPNTSTGKTPGRIVIRCSNTSPDSAGLRSPQTSEVPPAVPHIHLCVRKPGFLHFNTSGPFTEPACMRLCPAAIGSDPLSASPYLQNAVAAALPVLCFALASAY